jgi:hypothetical protein|tara:strand:- start:398 stop:976 length:579 start_codon:yes stop_codon:yes gene_type:complete
VSSITSRDKKSLVIGGAFIMLYLLFIFIAKPKYHEILLVNQKIQNKIIFIQKYYEVLSQKDYYKAKGVENKSINTTLNQRFLSKIKPSLAASEHQGLLEQLANKTGVNIIRFRVDKPKYTEKLLTISTEVTIRSKLRNLTNFIHLLESNQKFMVIEKILLQRINKTDLEELQAQLTVSGFIKKIEEETHKTT